jgi:arylsulfatase A-like enzyme
MTRRAACALAALLAAGCRPAAAPPPRPANLVLITVDTLRADHLGFAGYVRDTSPNLDALAREGSAFTRCYSVSATTGAAHASLFTSLLPNQHGVLANRQRFPRDLPSLMSVLRGRGYRTAAFVSSVVLGRKSGLQDQFDHFDDQGTTVELNRPGRPERPAAATLEAAAALLAGWSAGTPFFLWIHLIDPHGPYQAPDDPDRFVGDAHFRAQPVLLPIGRADWVFGQIPAYQALGDRREAEFYIARYDGEIRYADEALGRFFARLRALQLYDDSLVVVTADHGETLAEPGHKRYFAHGTITYEEVVRIPLVIREPGGRTRLRTASPDEPVSSLDVAPTILDLLGLPPHPGFQGRSLLRARARGEDPLFSLGAYGTPLLEKTIGTQFSVRQGPWRYLVNSLDGSEELYDHRVDPRETVNVAARETARAETLRAALGGLMSKDRRGAAPVEMTPEHQQALRSLGYVQ